MVRATKLLYRFVDSEGINFMGIEMDATKLQEAEAGSEFDLRMRAIQLVLDRGRAYDSNHGRSTTIQVFTTVEMEARTLKSVFKGNYYQHAGGFQWTVTAVTALEKIYLAIKDKPNRNREELKPLIDRCNHLDSIAMIIK